MCDRGAMSPISCCQRRGKQNPIIFVALVPLHFIHTPAVHGHLSLTPTLSPFLSPFEVAHVWLRRAALRVATGCTTLSSTSRAETGVALCGPGALRGGQPRHVGPNEPYCVCNRLQDHWSRNAGCEAWLGMAEEVFSSYHRICALYAI